MASVKALRDGEEQGLEVEALGRYAVALGEFPR